MSVPLSAPRRHKSFGLPLFWLQLPAVKSLFQPVSRPLARRERRLIGGDDTPNFNPWRLSPDAKENAMFRYIAIVIAAAAVPSAAHAATDGSTGFRVSLTVPEICQIETSVITVDAGGTSASGSVFEMCNSGRGFRIMASHRMLGDTEQAQINYGGETSQLDSSGTSDVALRNGPTVGSVPVQIQTSGLVQNLTISLGIAII